MTPPDIAQTPSHHQAGIRAARTALILLTLINLLNYIDRMIVPALIVTLKHVNLIQNDFQAGLLGTGFIIVYALASPVFGALGDTGIRPRLIATGVAIWSAATLLGGVAWGFVSLFVSRAAVGVGEAAYGTIAPSLLADYFPKARRGRVFAIFFAAIPVGSALGLLVGGLMDVHFGWRSAFFIAGAPGLVLAITLWRLPETPRGAQDADDPHAHAPVAAGWATYRDLLSNRPYLVTVLGYAAYTFALGGLAFWMPSFLMTVRAMPEKAAMMQLGGIVVATGLVGTYVGGWLGDYCLKYTANAYLLVSGIATLIAAPMAYLALTVTSPGLYTVALVAAELLIFASTGPINSAIVNYVAPAQRATAVALSVLLIHVLGDVPSPALIGAISKAGGNNAASLQHAILIVPCAILLGGIIWTAGALRRAR